MGFIDHVKGLRRSNAPLPFSSKVCGVIDDILNESKVDHYSTFESELKQLDSNDIDLIL